MKISKTLQLLAITVALLFTTQVSCLAQSVSCLPSKSWTYGSNDIGRWWAGWCDAQHVVVVACRHEACLSFSKLATDLKYLYDSPTIETINARMAYRKAGTLESVADVWKPDWAQIEAIRPKE